MDDTTETPTQEADQEAEDRWEELDISEFLSKRQRKIILKALEAGLRPDQAAPCDDALAVLDTLTTEEDEYPRADDVFEWWRWLAKALARHDLLMVQKIKPSHLRPERELPHRTADGQLRHWIELVQGELLPWYVPTQVLVWGCKKYLKRQREEKRNANG